MSRPLVCSLAAFAMALLAPAAVAQTQAEINAAAQADYRAADRVLNQAYGTVVGQASKSGRARLRIAQRDWIRFRDSDCAARAGSRGGSFYQAALAGCLAAHTRARTATLDAEARCAEGDMGCGGHRED